MERALTLQTKLDGTESLRCELPNAPLVGNAGCDSSSKKHETRIGAGVRLPLFCSRFHLSLCAPAREPCSQVPRIQILLRYSLAHWRLDLDPVFEKNDSGHHGGCTRTHACKKDMRYFQQEYSWLSLTDLVVARIALWKELESDAAQSRDPDSCSLVRNDLLIS